MIEITDNNLNFNQNKPYAASNNDISTNNADAARPIIDYDLMYRNSPHKARRYISGIEGERTVVKFIIHAGLEIVKINHLDDPSQYCNDHGTDIVARQRIYNRETGKTEYLYHIFEVTNFKEYTDTGEIVTSKRGKLYRKKSGTHMNNQVMRPKLDNLIEASYAYPNAKLWLVTSYDQFDRATRNRIHNIGATVLTMGRINKVWHHTISNNEFVNCKHGYDINVTYHTNQLKELRFILDGAQTREQTAAKHRAELIKLSLGHHKARSVNVIDQYFAAVNDRKMLNRIYKAKTRLNKLAAALRLRIDIDKIGKMIRNKLSLPLILHIINAKIKKISMDYKIKDVTNPKNTDYNTGYEAKDNTIEDNTKGKRNHANSVYVKPDVSKAQMLFRNKRYVGVFDGNTGITYDVASSLDRERIPDYIRDVLD